MISNDILIFEDYCSGITVMFIYDLHLEWLAVRI